MKRTKWSRWLILSAAVGLVSACGDDDPVDPGEPTDYDPVETAEQVSEVLDPVVARENAYLGLDAAADALLQFSGSEAQAVPAIRPDLLGSQPIGAARELRLHPARVRTARSFPAAYLVLPAEITGETLVWDPDENRYVVDPEQEGAPANGVRLIHYAMDPVSGVPVEPLAELGFIDLTDEDQEEEERLGIRVVDTSGESDVDLLDYYVGFQGNVAGETGESSITAVGALSDGDQTLDFDLQQHFTWDEGADLTAVDLTYAYTLDDASIVVEMDATGGFNASSYDAVSMAVDISNGEDDVDFNVDVAEDESVLGEILLNGDVVMEISGGNASPVFTRPGGGNLTQAEVTALVTVWNGAALALELADRLMAPVVLLLLPG